MYFTVSVVRQRDEYEIVIETRPIKSSRHPMKSDTHKVKTISVLLFRLYLHHIKLEKQYNICI